jgi:RecB family exonuclease
MLGPELRARLEEGIGPLVADRQPEQPLYLAKRRLAQVHACEGWLVADRGTPFAWSVAAARGTVAHKAVELAVTLRGNPSPLDLVELAIDRLIDSRDRGVSSWLLDAPAADVAEVRGAAADWIAKFQDTFPTLRRAWRPRVESALTVDLCGGRVILRGRVDLALGRAVGTTARVLIVDFKTGLPQPVHAEDLRFYALLEAIRVGVPPYRLATFSLDSGSWVAEDIDEAVLASAVRRTIDATAKLVALDEGAAPALRAGPFCRWCPAAAHCPAAPPDLRDADPDEGVDLTDPRLVPVGPHPAGIDLRRAAPHGARPSVVQRQFGRSSGLSQSAGASARPGAGPQRGG